MFCSRMLTLLPDGSTLRSVAWDSGRLHFGGDYNPEQWPRAVWAEDRAPHARGRRQPRLGRDLLLGPPRARARAATTSAGSTRSSTASHDAGIGVDLATATASPPPWLTTAHPESLPVDREGRRRWPGARQAYCPSSTAWRESGARARRAARRRATPTTRRWRCGTSATSTAATPRAATATSAPRASGSGWPTATATSTASTTPGARRSGASATPPSTRSSRRASRPDGAWANPTQQLDYRRFASDLLLEEFVAERDVLHRLSPGVPVTTNFMVMTRFNQLDYWAWAPRDGRRLQRLLPRLRRPADARRGRAVAPTSSRGLAGGEPWLLMETSPSAVNWQPRNPAKRPGSCAATRCSRSRTAPTGSTSSRSAPRSPARRSSTPGLIPHAGTDTRLWREVVELGGLLDRLGEVAGSRVEASVALVWDWQSWWGVRARQPPVASTSPTPTAARAFHRALWDLGVAVDVVAPGALARGLLASSSSRPSTSSTTTWRRCSTPTSAAAATSWSPTSPGSSTPTTTSAPAATPAPSARLLGDLRRGVRPAARRRAGRARRRRLGRRLDRGPPARRRGGVVHYVDGPRPRSRRRDPPRARRRRRLVRRHPHRRRDDGTARRADGRRGRRRAGRRRPTPGVEVQRRRKGDASLAVRAQPHRRRGLGRCARAPTSSAGTAVSGSVTLPAGGVAVVREGGGP